MNEIIVRLRDQLDTVAPFPDRCIGFEKRPLFTGTAFFPGGDGLWKPTPGNEPAFPFHGTLVLGSDFGDVIGYDRQFEIETAWRSETGGATWRKLLKLLSAAGIEPSEAFFTNAWPCLRAGDEPVRGGIPGSENADFTSRCAEFFRLTVERMQPSLIVPLGIAPTRFVARCAPEDLSLWIGATSWKQIDEMPSARAFGATIVPIVHPSMPNRRHRKAANSLADEAALLATARA